MLDDEIWHSIEGVLVETQRVNHKHVQDPKISPYQKLKEMQDVEMNKVEEEKIID